MPYSYFSDSTGSVCAECRIINDAICIGLRGELAKHGIGLQIKDHNRAFSSAICNESTPQRRDNGYAMRDLLTWNIAQYIAGVGVDQMMRDARRAPFDVVLIWVCDRIARSTRHFLDVLDDLNRLNNEFVSFREQTDTGGPLGRAIVVIIGAIAELERSLIVERVRAGMRRAKLEARHIGREPLELDRPAILRDRNRGQSL